MAKSGAHPNREDIKAAIRKTGITCEKLAMQHGFHRSAVAVCLLKPWPAVEAVIAAHLGCRAQALWPNRYDASGNSVRRPYGDAENRTGRASARHSQKQAAA